MSTLHHADGFRHRRLGQVAAPRIAVGMRNWANTHHSHPRGSCAPSLPGWPAHPAAHLAKYCLTLAPAAKAGLMVPCGALSRGRAEHLHIPEQRVKRAGIAAESGLQRQGQYVWMHLHVPMARLYYARSWRELAGTRLDECEGLAAVRNLRLHRGRERAVQSLLNLRGTGHLCGVQRRCTHRLHMLAPG